MRRSTASPSSGSSTAPTDPRPVVLLHGVPTSARLWDPLRAHLPGRTFVVPDLPGHGGTAPLADGRLDTLVDWLAPQLDGLHRPHVVGHDYGGVLAAAWSSRHPVASLTLSGTALGPLWHLSRLAARPPFHRYFYDRFAGRRYLAAGVGDAVRARFLDTFPPEGPEFPGWMRALALGIDPSALLAMRIDAPVACAWGRDDRWFPSWGGRRLARRLRARFVVVPGRHYAAWEHPGDFAAVLLDFWPTAVPTDRSLVEIL